MPSKDRIYRVQKNLPKPSPKTRVVVDEGQVAQINAMLLNKDWAGANAFRREHNLRSNLVSKRAALTKFPETAAISREVRHRLVNTTYRDLQLAITNGINKSDYESLRSQEESNVEHIASQIRRDATAEVRYPEGLSRESQERLNSKARSRIEATDPSDLAQLKTALSNVPTTELTREDFSLLGRLLRARQNGGLATRMDGSGGFADLRKELGVAMAKEDRSTVQRSLRNHLQTAGNPAVGIDPADSDSDSETPEPGEPRGSGEAAS